MRRFLYTALGLVLVFAMGTVKAEAPKPQDDPKIASVQSVIENVKLKDPNIPIRLFAQGRKLTVNVVTPAAPLKAHYHAKHEEAVYVIRGKGKMTLGDKTRDVKAGDIVFIPRKTPHSFAPEGSDCQVLSVFGPAFDGKDRIFIEEKK
jgi:quercetin dioxygenase-like cupin family protein